MIRLFYKIRGPKLGSPHSSGSGSGLSGFGGGIGPYGFGFKILTKSKELKSVYPNLAKFKLFISHTGLEEETNQLKHFMISEVPSLIICVGRCREGFDDPMVDVGINLEPVQNRGVVVFVQKTGRTLRHSGEKVKGHMMDTFTLISEEEKTKQICNLVVGYCLFLEDCDCGSVDEELKSADYEKLISNIKVNTSRGCVTYRTPKGKEIVINIKSTSMKTLDWKKLPHKLIEDIKSRFYSNGIGYETTKSIIRSAEPKIMTKEAYFTITKVDKRLPEDPEEVFKGQFRGWIDYLSIERKYYDLETCKVKCREYIKTKVQVSDIYNYSGICQALCSLDDNFPPLDLWCDYYNVKVISQLIVMSKKKKPKFLFK